MAKRYHWPQCTVPGCGHVRTWRTEEAAQNAYLRHATWSVGKDATCYCHGLEAGATFPCDHTERVIHSV